MTYNGLRTAYSCGSDGSLELSSARANCKLEEDLHVRHSHLSGSEKVQPILESKRRKYLSSLKKGDKPPPMFS